MGEVFTRMEEVDGKLKFKNVIKMTHLIIKDRN